MISKTIYQFWIGFTIKLLLITDSKCIILLNYIFNFQLYLKIDTRLLINLKKSLYEIGI